jgi:hypothetical protein
MLKRSVVMLCCLMMSTAWAIEQLYVTIGHWQFESEKPAAMELENIGFNISYTQQGLIFKFTADEVRVPPPFDKLTDVMLQCVEVKFHAQQISCIKGLFSFTQKELGSQNINFTVVADPEQQQYRIQTSGLVLASAKISGLIIVDRTHWQLDANASKIDVKTLSTFIQPYLSKTQQQTIQSWDHAGKVSLKLTANGDSENFNQAQISTSLSELELSDESGQFVTEGLASNLTLHVNRQGALWRWQTTLNIEQGQGYASPVFLDFNEAPITFEAKGVWHQKKNRLEVITSVINHKNVAQADIELTLSEYEIERLNIRIAKTKLLPIYRHWLQPFTVGTAIDNLSLKGQASLSYQQEKSGYELQLGLDNVSAEDGLKRFAIQGASGKVAWTTLEKSLPISLKWQQATLYTIPIGASALKAQTQLGGVKLLAPWRVPILDGELQINDFALNQQSTSGVTWDFEGLLTPISMSELSTQIGWPELHGKLSGVIPKVAYQAEEIKVDGALMVKLFEGTTIIHDLRLTKPFGAIPQVYANIDLISFDLETMTETFDFGKITGTIEGKVQNLRLANWQPVAFDAYLRTPQNDTVRHRISQQAVNNLSELGGGASGALSRSVLRFFEDFSYQRLGLSCKLRNEVCEMDGVEPAEQGYYMVKGGGLPPRINVIGYTRLVDWPELVTRLEAVSNSAGPVVQ